jgi:hypothetical protein
MKHLYELKGLTFIQNINRLFYEILSKCDNQLNIQLKAREKFINKVIQKKNPLIFYLFNSRNIDYYMKKNHIIV